MADLDDADSLVAAFEKSRSIFCYEISSSLKTGSEHDLCMRLITITKETR